MAADRLPLKEGAALDANKLVGLLGVLRVTRSKACK
jgi:hypothetical protein